MLVLVHAHVHVLDIFMLLKQRQVVYAHVNVLAD